MAQGIRSIRRISVGEELLSTNQPSDISHPKALPVNSNTLLVALLDHGL